MKFILKVLALFMAALNAMACAIIPKDEVVTETLLPAKPEQVWQVLTDGSKYSEWNPFIVNVEGRFVKGERLINTMEPTPNKQVVFKPKVLEARLGNTPII